MLKQEVGRKKKLQKKCQKGEIASVDNYFECKTLGITGTPDISLVKDNSRKISKHDLNLPELRDLIVSLMADKITPKYFQIKNKPFARFIVILHISDCVDFESDLRDLQLGEVIHTRVSRNPSEVCCLPQKLLTISMNDCSDDTLLNNSKTNPVAASTEAAPIVESTKKPTSMQTVLSKYALSPAVMRLWGYPMVVGSVVSGQSEDTGETNVDTNCGKRPMDVLTASENSEVDGGVSPACKKSRTDGLESSTTTNNTDTTHQSSVNSTGLYTGFIPSVEEASLVLNQLPSFKVACFEGTPYGPSGRTDDLYRQTVSQFSPEYLIVKGNGQGAPLSIAAVDCEMCQSASGPVVTRVTVVDADSTVVLDVLVQPSETITEYRTQFSGITAEMLVGVTTTLQQVQVSLLRLISAETVLVGHSLENDLRSLRLCHSLCVDTAVLFPHPKGYPLRLKLKTLASDFLNLTIQKADSKKGHDSVEDARAALQLALLKAERGPMFGVKNTDTARVSVCSQFPANTSTLLAWEREVSTITVGSSDMSAAVEGDSSAVVVSSAVSVSPSSESYLMESCIGGNAIVGSSDTAAGTVDVACRFIVKQSLEADDRMCLVYVGIKRPAGVENAVSSANVLTHIAAIKTAVQSTSRHGVLIVTAQNNSDVLTSLRTKKRVCLKNPMASAVWSRENEDQLQFAAGLNAMGGVVLSVI